DQHGHDRHRAQREKSQPEGRHRLLSSELDSARRRPRGKDKRQSAKDGAATQPDETTEVEQSVQHGCLLLALLDLVKLHPASNGAAGNVGLVVGAVLEIARDARVRPQRQVVGPHQDLAADWPAELQRSAAGSDPATHRAKRADRLACRDQAAVDATTRADVDLLGQASDAASNMAVDRDYRASGAHIAVYG